MGVCFEIPRRCGNSPATPRRRIKFRSLHSHSCNLVSVTCCVLGCNVRLLMMSCHLTMGMPFAPWVLRRGCLVLGSPSSSGPNRSRRLTSTGEGVATTSMNELVSVPHNLPRKQIADASCLYASNHRSTMTDPSHLASSKRSGVCPFNNNSSTYQADSLAACPEIRVSRH
jgi:hypothetical protein